LIALAKPDLSGNELKYLTECIQTGYITHAGRFEAAFEGEFAKRFGPCIATSSGTGALHLALLSLGVGPGDEVLLPSLAFGAVGSVVLACGARPVIIDIDPETWGMDKTKILYSLTKKTRAIISVHNYGEDAGDLTQFGVPVIEDSCEAIGMVPIRGKMQTYSFYGNKVITTGEGGMLCGDFGNAAEWRNGGFDREYRHLVPGLNYRMTNMQAALGLAQFERFEDLLKRRLENAAYYKRHLKGKGKWLFAARVDNPVAVARALSELGVETRPIFTPLNLSPAFRVYAKGKYKVAEEVWANHLCLPTGPHLKEEEQKRIVDLVNNHV